MRSPLLSKNSTQRADCPFFGDLLFGSSWHGVPFCFSQFCGNQSDSHLGAGSRSSPTQSFTIPNSLLLRTDTHASLVRTVYSYAARGPGGRRGRQPQIPCSRRLHSPAGRRNLFVSLSWKPLLQ